MCHFHCRYHLQPLKDSVPAESGITREVNSESWREVQLSEFEALWADLKSAPGLLNKLCYLVMPPGWSHTGDHKTVSVQKAHYATNTSADT